MRLLDLGRYVHEGEAQSGPIKRWRMTKVRVNSRGDRLTGCGMRLAWRERQSMTRRQGLGSRSQR